MKLNNIRLLVKDFDSCFEFYAKTVGLKATWGKPGGDYASFNIGMPSGLSLYKSDIMAQALGNNNLDLPGKHRDKMAIIVKVDNVDESYGELKDKGVVFVNEPTDMTGWGMRAAHFRDPENNLIEIWSELDRSRWDKDLQEDAKEFEGK